MKAPIKALLLLWLFPAAAIAAEEVPPQPITIAADRAEIDERQGMSTYSGHVVLTQGETRMDAERIVVFTEDGDLKSISAEGDPVIYQQARPNEEPLRGQSLRMRYDADTEMLLLQDKAEFWQGPNRFSGEQIQYDRKQGRVTASQGENGGGRVRVTIQPKVKPKEESAP